MSWCFILELATIKLCYTKELILLVQLHTEAGSAKCTSWKIDWGFELLPTTDHDEAAYAAIFCIMLRQIQRAETGRHSQSSSSLGEESTPRLAGEAGLFKLKLSQNLSTKIFAVHWETFSSLNWTSRNKEPATATHAPIKKAGSQELHRSNSGGEVSGATLSSNVVVSNTFYWSKQTSNSFLCHYQVL